MSEKKLREKVVRVTLVVTISSDGGHEKLAEALEDIRRRKDQFKTRVTAGYWSWEVSDILMPGDGRGRRAAKTPR